MEFEQQLTKSEYISAMKIYTRKHSKIGKRVLRLYIFLSSISFVLFLSIFTAVTISFLKLRKEFSYYSFGLFFKEFVITNYIYLILVLFILTASIYMIYGTYIFPDKQSKKWVENKDNHRTFIRRLYGVNKDGLTVKNKENDNFYVSISWNMIKNVYETKDFFILELSSNQVEILSKNQIGISKVIEIKQIYQENKDKKTTKEFNKRK